MGRTKDQYIEYLNTLDQDDPQNREIQDRDGEGFVNSPPRQQQQTERDRNVIDDR